MLISLGISNGALCVGRTGLNFHCQSYQLICMVAQQLSHSSIRMCVARLDYKVAVELQVYIAHKVCAPVISFLRLLYEFFVLTVQYGHSAPRMSWGQTRAQFRTELSQLLLYTITSTFPSHREPTASHKLELLQQFQVILTENWGTSDSPVVIEYLCL